MVLGPSRGACLPFESACGYPQGVVHMSIRTTPETPMRETHPVVFDAGMVSYELVRSLGQGHHGELLLTRQRYHDGAGGLTVLKRLNRVVRQEDYQRLVEEARLGGQLRHPNIVSVELLGGTP